MTTIKWVLGGACCAFLAACGGESLNDRQLDESTGLAGQARGNQVLPPVDGILDRRRPPANPDRNVYFGDLHVHTANSFDAYSAMPGDRR